MDTIINATGIAYGVALILASFVRSRVLESMRVDVMFIPQASEKTRPVNLFVGLLVSGYAIYSLWLR